MTGPFPDVTHAPTRGPGQTGVLFRPRLGRQNPPGGMGPWDASNAGPVTVSFIGPWADGRLAAAVAGLVEAMAWDVGVQAYADVMFNLNRSIQHPTPYYETQIMVQRQADDVVVHDRKIIYGPWLEGTSSRNRTTRFKGYASFRRAADELRRKAAVIIVNTATRYLSKVT